MSCRDSGPRTGGQSSSARRFRVSLCAPYLVQRCAPVIYRGGAAMYMCARLRLDGRRSVAIAPWKRGSKKGYDAARRSGALFCCAWRCFRNCFSCLLCLAVFRDFLDNH